MCLPSNPPSCWSFQWMCGAAWLTNARITVHSRLIFPSTSREMPLDSDQLLTLYNLSYLRQIIGLLSGLTETPSEESGDRLLASCHPKGCWDPSQDGSRENHVSAGLYSGGLTICTQIQFLGCHCHPFSFLSHEEYLP